MARWSEFGASPGASFEGEAADRRKSALDSPVPLLRALSCICLAFGHLPRSSRFYFHSAAIIRHRRVAL